MTQNDEIKVAKSAFELNVAIKKLLNRKYASQEVALLLRDQIFKLCLSKGSLLERSNLALFRIYSALNLEGDERFLKIRDQALKIVQSSSLDNEKILLYELAFACDFLGREGLKESKLESLKIYLEGLCLLDSHALEVSHAQAGSLEILNGVEFDTFKDTLLYIFEHFWERSAKERRSILNACLHVFWNVAQFYNEKRWLDFYDIWKEIFQRALECDLELAVYMQFFVYHMCGNAFSSQEQWKTFNEDFTKRAQGYYKKDESYKSSLNIADKNNGCRKVGFLRDRLVLNSPMKVELSLLETLAKSEFEITIFLLSIIEKSDNDATILQDLLNLGVRLFDVGTGVLLSKDGALQIAPNINKDGLYNSHLQKARVLESVIKSANLDLLISPNNGYGISDYVLCKRVCAKQIFWSHGNFVYDAPFIDKKITHICNLQERITHEGVEFYGLPVRMAEKFYVPAVDRDAVDAVRAKYPNRIILGNIGRLVKMESAEFLSALVQILKSQKNAVFLACGGGSSERISEKIRELDEEVSGRVIFPGYVDSALYGYVIDFWLDSFPLNHGESRIEYMAKGHLSLVFSPLCAEVRRSNIEFWAEQNDAYINEALKGSSMAKKDFLEFIFNNDDLVAWSADDYVQKALSALSMNKILKARHIECAKITRVANNLAKEALCLSRFRNL